MTNQSLDAAGFPQSEAAGALDVLRNDFHSVLKQEPASVIKKIDYFQGKLNPAVPTGFPSGTGIIEGRPFEYNPKYLKGSVRQVETNVTNVRRNTDLRLNNNNRHDDSDAIADAAVTAENVRTSTNTRVETGDTRINNKVGDSLSRSSATGGDAASNSRSEGGDSRSSARGGNSRNDIDIDFDPVVKSGDSRSTSRSGDVDADIKVGDSKATAKSGDSSASAKQSITINIDLGDQKQTVKNDERHHDHRDKGDHHHKHRKEKDGDKCGTDTKKGDRKPDKKGDGDRTCGTDEVNDRRQVGDRLPARRPRFNVIVVSASELPQVMDRLFGRAQGSGLDSGSSLPTADGLIRGLQRMFRPTDACSMQPQPRLSTPDEFVRDLGELLRGGPCGDKLPSPQDFIEGLQKALVKGDNDSNLPEPPGPEQFIRQLAELLGYNRDNSQLFPAPPGPEQFLQGLARILGFGSSPIGSSQAFRTLGPRQAAFGGNNFRPISPKGRAVPVPFGDAGFSASLAEPQGLLPNPIDAAQRAASLPLDLAGKGVEQAARTAKQAAELPKKAAKEAERAAKKAAELPKKAAKEAGRVAKKVASAPVKIAKKIFGGLF